MSQQQQQQQATVIFPSTLCRLCDSRYGTPFPLASLQIHTMQYKSEADMMERIVDLLVDKWGAQMCDDLRCCLNVGSLIDMVNKMIRDQTCLKFTVH